MADVGPMADEGAVRTQGAPPRTEAVVILAAGAGTRMKSSKPKVLHEICGRPLVGHAVVAAKEISDELVVVVGHGREQVVPYLTGLDPQIRTAVQDQQLGTGHAVQCALAAIPDVNEGVVVVTSGDVPMLSGQTLARLVATHHEEGNGVTLLTAILDNPHGYGRILRDGNGPEGGPQTGAVKAIREHKDATEAERAVKEINAGIYAFDADVLRRGIDSLRTDNAQGELYLTDVIAFADSEGRRVGAVVCEDPWQTEGVNDRVQLSQMRKVWNGRIVEHWMREGVTVIDPATTWIDVDVTLAQDVTLEPGTQLRGRTTVGEGSTIGPDTLLDSCQIGAGCQVLRTHAIGATFADGAQSGPFTFLRPGTLLGPKARAGGFVEVKNASIGAGSKVPHLSYVGDAEIGEGANIGAATVFVNYDGVHKHRTVVGDHVRIGSDTMLVAPVTIGDGAYTAAGSVITEDVPAGAMGVGRARQTNLEDWVVKKRPGTDSAQAAQDAQDQDEQSGVQQ